MLGLNDYLTTAIPNLAQESRSNLVAVKKNHTMNDVSKQLEKLRETARVLQLPGADRINWTLIASSTSDCAATQKCFNKLIEDRRDNDALHFGSATSETLDIVESLQIWPTFSTWIPLQGRHKRGNKVMHLHVVEPLTNLSTNSASSLANMVLPSTAVVFMNFLTICSS